MTALAWFYMRSTACRLNSRRYRAIISMCVQISSALNRYWFIDYVGLCNGDNHYNEVLYSMHYHFIYLA